ncbi:unnamed protein product [Caenorhabditis bovis]|uniref:Rho-GAP domain-containing protein n=1 Tax=Caenorhabditis bovis TaxID=2654633 RepID=A0A8S1F4C2_9PELO|nr:unnamed protein product [Caenorhabditis bovis]
MTFYSNSGSYTPGKDMNVDEVMRGWQDRYCTFNDVRICVSTFNVNGRSPPSVLPTWFSHDKKDLCEFYAIGLQEMDLSVGTYLIDNTKKMDEWCEAIRASLPLGRSHYRVVSSMRLVGIFVIVFQSLQSHIQVSHVETNHVATGISVLMNKLGNKGGTAISMKMNDSWVCFVNSHFAAGNNELERRNQDFRDISQMTFAGSSRTIFDHDVIFWFGDLNYRLNSEYAGISNEEVRLVASSQNFGRLLDYCQLREQMSRGQVFNGFVEPKVFGFRPTYKYDVGTCVWDTSEKGRVPAWTDRILTWKQDSFVKLDIVRPMESVESISISDHKPVRAIFNLKVKLIDEEKQKALYEEAIREADRRANELLPQIKLSLNEVDFGEVNYLDPTTRLITVTNVGKSQVRFNFKITPAGKGICANWLQVTPPHYAIPTGQSTQISITVSINTKTLRELVGKNPVLQDILVLHLEHGRDYFIPVLAKYNAKVFGSSLEKLLNNKPKKEENLIDFIYRLVNALRSTGAAKINLSEHSDNADFNRVRIALETNHPKDLNGFASPFTLYSALIRLLDTLEDPVVPSGMDGIIHYEFIRSARDATALWKVVATVLPRENQNVLEVVCMMLREFISQSVAFREQLHLWSQILFRYPPQSVQLQSAVDPRVTALQTLCEYGKDAVLM